MSTPLDQIDRSATFAMAFFSFTYSNISRFERFKGLGFEAELWEDKQKEAAQLIGRLKAVVTVYTREVVLQKVMQGRWGDGVKWQENWGLYDELVAKHNELGQTIDFSDLKAKLDKVFLFDIVSKLYEPIRKSVTDGRGKAKEMISEEFGSPIKDIKGHSARFALLRETPEDLRGLYETSMQGNVALEVIEWTHLAQTKLKENFGIEVDLPENSISKLEKISSLCQSGPIKVTDGLFAMAN